MRSRLLLPVNRILEMQRQIILSTKEFTIINIITKLNQLWAKGLELELIWFEDN
jgi:hypothetical protein